MSAATAAVETPADEALEDLEKPRYNFDQDFQHKIAAMAVRDEQFMQRADGLIKPEYFEDSLDAAWVSMAVRYYQKYKRIPADNTIYAKLIKADLTAKIVDPTMAHLMVGHYKNVLLTADVSDREYVVDEVASFARHQAVTKAILQAVTDLDRRDFSKIEKAMRKALDVGANSDGDIYDFGERIENRTGVRLERAAGKLPPTGITTGVPELDAVLYHKGWGRRELSVLLGPAKAGKTTALLDFGLKATAAGHNTLYLTLEVASEILAERADANVSQVPVMDLGNHTHDVKAKVQAFAAASGAKFIIKEFPSGSATVSDLRRLIERFKARGIIFDLVIVDYGDIMAPERITDNVQENSKSVYVGLRGLAMAEGFAVLTATQTNRDGVKAAVIKAEHVAEDFNKIRIADLVISLNRTDEERAQGLCRLHFAASRNQAGGFTIKVEQHLATMRFITKFVGYE